MHEGNGDNKGNEAIAPLARRILGVILVASLLGITGLYLFSLANGGFAVVEGRSMEPLLHSGDLVFLLSGRDPVVGDVVVYRDNMGRFIIHRVISIYKVNGLTCYVIKGDNNVIPDLGDPEDCIRPVNVEGYSSYGVPRDRIVGVVISINGNPIKIPYVGGLTLALKE